MKNTRNQPRKRLQTLDVTQLEKVTAGTDATHLANLGASYEPGSGWYEFFFAASSAASR